MFSIERNGFTSIKDLANSLIGEMIGILGSRTSDKFRLVSPAAYDNNVVKATLETRPEMVSLDSEGNPQHWRVVIDADYSNLDPSTEALDSFLRIYVGTEHQHKNDGTSTKTLVRAEIPYAPAVSEQGHYVSLEGYGNYLYVVDVPAVPEQPYVPPLYYTTGELTTRTYADDAKKLAGKKVPFFSYDCDDLDATLSQSIQFTASQPISYKLTISENGFALFIWLEDSDKFGDKYSWCCIQRLVDSETGIANINDKSPIFCLFSTGGGKPDKTPYIFGLDYSNVGLPQDLLQIYRITVREADVNWPSLPINACINTIDNNAVMNGNRQISLFEDKRIKIMSPMNFNTSRYRYGGIMNLILYTSADVLSQWRIIEVSKGTKILTYSAMQSNLSNNAGMRMLILINIS